MALTMDPDASGSETHSRSSLESDLDIDIVQELQQLPLRPRRSEQQASYRHSMDEFYEHEAAMTNADNSSPPPYNSLLSSFPRRKYVIQPREDEGREKLPKYSTAISLQGVFSMKRELEGVVKRCGDRNWYRVLVTLQGTALNIHRVKSSGLFGQEMGSKQSGKKDSSLIRSYNLVHADVGIAADYHKKRHVIRVRAETDQFLLSCSKIETFVHWLQSLNTAIDIAPPLDDRPLPRDLSIPRAHRRQLRRPILPPATTPESSFSPSVNPTPSSSQTPTTSSASNQNQASQRVLHGGAPSHSLARARRMLPASTEPRDNTSPNLTSDGKWHPTHNWTQFYDMMYAKRCMAVLTDKSPRKSNLAVVKGKLWVVDWGTGQLMECREAGLLDTTTQGSPPEYAESISSGASERGSF